MIDFWSKFHFLVKSVSYIIISGCFRNLGAYFDGYLVSSSAANHMTTNCIRQINSVTKAFNSWLHSNFSAYINQPLHLLEPTPLSLAGSYLYL